VRLRVHGVRGGVGACEHDVRGAATTSKACVLANKHYEAPTTGSGKEYVDASAEYESTGANSDHGGNKDSARSSTRVGSRNSVAYSWVPNYRSTQDVLASHTNLVADSKYWLVSGVRVAESLQAFVLRQPCG
jgi:hypothetical protein